jgi:hypothetical protein
MRVRVGLIVTVIAGLLLAACGNGSGEVVAVGDTTLLVGESTDGGMDSALSGSVVVLDGCLGIRSYVVVWPNGTDVGEEDPVRIDVPGYGTLQVGDDARIGGGLVYEPSERSEPADHEVAGITVPGECAKHGIWLAAPR